MFNVLLCSRGMKIGRNPYYESIDYPADEALASAVEDGIASVEQVHEPLGFEMFLARQGRKEWGGG